MQYLTKIVCSINDIIKNNAFSGFKVHDYAISEKGFGADVNQRFPSVINYKGEVEPIVADDLYDILIYHKLEGTSTTVKKGYGRNSDISVENVSMVLMLFAFRDKTRKTIDWFESSIKEVIPRTIIQSVIKFNSSSYDTPTLLTREWVNVPGLDYTKLSGLEIRYSIQNTQVKCLPKCNNTDGGIYTEQYLNQYV